LSSTVACAIGGAALMLLATLIRPRRRRKPDNIDRLVKALKDQK
jgi:hypothetical protein